MTVGGVLQFAGVALVFVEISGVQRTLRLAPWWKALVNDLASAVRRVVGRKPRTTVGASVDIPTRFTMTSHPRTPLAAGSTIEELLKSHRRELEKLRHELDEIWRAVDSARTEQRRAVEALAKRLDKEIGELQQLLRELSGGSLRGRALGGALILLGTALITIGVWT